MSLSNEKCEKIITMIKQVIRFILKYLRIPITLKSEMIIKKNCEVDFRRHNSISSLLGFDSKLYTSGFNESENMVNILTINSILVDIDIISGSYVNGSTQFTRSFQMSLPFIKLSKILIIFSTSQ